MKVSLLISTYNWHEALELCLLSVLNQSRLPDEVVIADDGSDSKTSDVIKKIASKCSFNIKHIWHEDQGFRKTIILNKAIVACTSEYIIQIDGDEIIHRHFVKNHISVAKKGFFVRGARVMLGQSTTNKVLNQRRIKISFFEKDLIKRRNCIYMPLLGKYTTALYNSKSSKYILGSNFAFWKNDVINVNGYNEDITEWGAEDNEIGERLINNAVYRRVVRWAIIVFHLHHVERSRIKLMFNRDIYNKTMMEKSKWCKNGIDKYLTN